MNTLSNGQCDKDSRDWREHILSEDYIRKMKEVARTAKLKMKEDWCKGLLAGKCYGCGGRIEARCGVCRRCGYERDFSAEEYNRLVGRARGEEAAAWGHRNGCKRVLGNATDAGLIVPVSPSDGGMNAPLLEGADLRGLQLNGVDFSGGCLDGADLSSAHLRGAVLTWANLRDAKLTGADPTGARLNLVSLQNADLSGAILEDSDFEGALVEGAHFAGNCVKQDAARPPACGCPPGCECSRR
jgi:hypothetical protein